MKQHHSQFVNDPQELASVLKLYGKYGYGVVALTPWADAYMLILEREIDDTPPRPSETARIAPVECDPPQAAHLDWAVLHQWLHAQERQQYREDDGELSYYTGLFEGRDETARMLSELPVEMPADQKLAVLYTRLHETLMRTESPEEEQD